MIIVTLVNSLLFWIAWVAALFFVVRNDGFYASLSIWIPTFIQFCISFRLNFWARWIELYLALYTFFIALILETSLIEIHAVHYKTMEEGAIFPPFWILGLWVFFATTMNRILSLMNKSYWSAPLLGIVAPFSYLAGEKVGACTFPKGTLFALIALFIAWTLAALFLIYLNRALRKIDIEMHAIYQSPEKIEMLFDGACPLCSREKEYLSKKGGSIDFVDITSSAYGLKDHYPTYKEAMEKMIAINEKNELFYGTKAFFVIWSKAGLFGLAMLMKAPFLSLMMQGGYLIFARYRLILTGRSAC